MPADPAASRVIAFQRIGADAASASIERDVAEERPIAIEYGGIGYAVLMASPTALADLAYGFSLTERLIERADDIVDIVIHAVERGTVVRITLREERMSRVAERVRHRVSESSCGLCGIENLEQALRPLPRVTATTHTDDAALFRALDMLGAHQPLNRATGAVHAAALCDAGGNLLIAREDVGRHNGFDKLIGAMLRAGKDWDGGFALLSSRCSFELVEKAVLSGCPMLVTISAPTALAVERAQEAGLPLVVLARPDAVLRA